MSPVILSTLLASGKSNLAEKLSSRTGVARYNIQAVIFWDCLQLSLKRFTMQVPKVRCTENARSDFVSSPLPRSPP